MKKLFHRIATALLSTSPALPSWAAHAGPMVTAPRGGHHRRLTRQFLHRRLIAPKLVLTAAHCVQPGADYNIVDRGAPAAAEEGPHRRVIRPSTCRRCRHIALLPTLRCWNWRFHQGKWRAGSACRTFRSAGSRFTIAGIGVTIRGDGRSGGGGSPPCCHRPARHAPDPAGRSRRPRFAKDLAPAPAIPAGPCSRTGRAELYRRRHQLVNRAERQPPAAAD